LTGKKYFIYPK